MCNIYKYKNNIYLIYINILYYQNKINHKKSNHEIG